MDFETARDRIRASFRLPSPNQHGMRHRDWYVGAYGRASPDRLKAREEGREFKLRPPPPLDCDWSVLPPEQRSNFSYPPYNGEPIAGVPARKRHYYGGRRAAARLDARRRNKEGFLQPPPPVECDWTLLPPDKRREHQDPPWRGEKIANLRPPNATWCRGKRALRYVPEGWYLGVGLTEEDWAHLERQELALIERERRWEETKRRLSEKAKARHAATYVPPLRPARPPPAPDAAGKPGSIAWDSGFVYVCVAPNTWRRAPLSPW